MAHCVTARLRNFSHYCCPLRQYDVRYTCSEHRDALAGAPTAHGVHKQEFTVQGGSIVRHWISTEASLRHSSGWGTWSVSPQYRDLRTRGLTACAMRQPHESIHDTNSNKEWKLGFFTLCSINLYISGSKTFLLRDPPYTLKIFRDPPEWSKEG